MNTKTRLTGLAVAAVALVGCANLPSVAELNQITEQIDKASFRTHAHVNVERLTQPDDTNRLCGEADASGKPLDDKVAKSFPTGEAVNQALLGLLALTEQTAQITGRSKPAARKRAAV